MIPLLCGASLLIGFVWVALRDRSHPPRRRAARTDEDPWDQVDEHGWSGWDYIAASEALDDWSDDT